MIARKPFELDESMIYLLESLSVEGHWIPTHGSAIIQNKNLPFLRKIESIIKSIGLRPHKRVLVKIKLEDSDVSKNDIQVYNGVKNVNFHLETSPFDGSKRIVTSQPYDSKIALKFKIQNNAFSAKIHELEDEFSSTSKFDVRAYLSLTIPSKPFVEFISNLVKDRKNLRLGSYVAKSDEAGVMAAFSALIDCEGSVDQYGLQRRIRVRMFNQHYLEDWQKLLRKYQIQSRVSQNNEKEYGLCVEGWEDFDRLANLGFELFHSKKKEKFENIMKSYKRNQVSRHTAEDYYIKLLHKLNRPVSARELAEKSGKSKRVVNHYLKILMDKRKIKVDKSAVRYAYSIK